MVERGILVVNVSPHRFTALYDRLNGTTSSELRLDLHNFPVVLDEERDGN
jgi:hypothetical protein